MELEGKGGTVTIGGVRFPIARWRGSKPEVVEQLPDLIDPRWRTATVIDLAKAIDGPFDPRISILSDALMDAGCDNAEIHEALRNYPMRMDQTAAIVIALADGVALTDLCGNWMAHRWGHRWFLEPLADGRAFAEVARLLKIDEIRDFVGACIVR